MPLKIHLEKPLTNTSDLQAELFHVNFFFTNSNAFRTIKREIIHILWEHNIWKRNNFGLVEVERVEHYWTRSSPAYWENDNQLMIISCGHGTFKSSKLDWSLFLTETSSTLNIFAGKRSVARKLGKDCVIYVSWKLTTSVDIPGDLSEGNQRIWLKWLICLLNHIDSSLSETGEHINCIESATHLVSSMMSSFQWK